VVFSKLCGDKTLVKRRLPKEYKIAKGTNGVDEGFFESLVNTSGCIFLVTDKNMKVKFINLKGCEILGNKREKVIGRNWIKEFIPRGHRKFVMNDLNFLKGQGEVVVFERPILTKSGEFKYISWQNTILPNGDILWTGYDVTDRKEIEAALIKSERKFSNLFEYSGDAIVIHDIEGRILDANRKLLEYLGYERRVIVSKNFFDFLADKSGEVKRILKNINRKKHIVIETQLIQNDGGTFYAEISSTLLEFKDMKIIQSIIKDISERKKAEEELRMHRERLEELVNRRTNELLRINKDLKKEIQERKKAEKKLLEYQKQLQSLASEISLMEERQKRRIATELHDCIGQSLALAKIKLGMLCKLAPKELKGPLRELLQLVEQTIKETRTLTFELSPPILYELGFEQAIKWLADQLGEKYGLKIKISDDGKDKPIDTSIRFFLFQAIRELLINIIKHADSEEAEIVLKRRGNRLKISVIDRGIGFDPAMEKYSGYGLFNIREKMNHINGRFEIESSLGKGTKVTLIAPFKLKEIRKKRG